MDDTEESIRSILTLQLKKQLHVDDSKGNITNMLKVKYEFLSQTRVLNFTRPVLFDDLYEKISISLYKQKGLLLHYTGPNKEIFGQISCQAQLDQIVQCVDRNSKYRSLRVLVTTTETIQCSPRPSSLISRQESPPPGCLYPNDHIHMERSTTFPTSLVDGEFIPEDEDLSTSQSDDSSYFSSRQSLLDGVRPGSGRWTRPSNVPPYPELLENDNNGSKHQVSTFPKRTHQSPFSNLESRQTAPRLRSHSGHSGPIVSSGHGSSINSWHLTDDYDLYQVCTEKTITTAKVPSLVDFKKGPLLGRGGFGQVFRCLDSQTGREFAMKEVLLPSGACYNTDAINRDAVSLENEINIYKGLKSHTRIVQYFGATRDQSSMFIFMEYMAGGSVKDQLKLYGPLSQNITVRYTKQILQGLVFLHQSSIIHRDIKAANILRDINGNVKLSDFGTSRYLKSISAHNSDEKKVCGGKATTFCGTFFWMAPEVIRGEPYSISADVWSLGATIVEMLTGNPPYHTLEPFAALFKIANISKVEYTIPESKSTPLQALIDRMFVTNPRDRDTAEALLLSDLLTNIYTD